MSYPNSTSSYSNGQLITQFDYSKLFLFNNRFFYYTYRNSTGSSASLVAGTLMGRQSSGSHVGEVIPQVSSATDGSQVPMGILARDYTVANGATATVMICVAGDVDTSLLTFGGSDTMATVISLPDSAGTPNLTKIGCIQDLLMSKGIFPIVSTDNTIADN